MMKSRFIKLASVQHDQARKRGQVVRQLSLLVSLPESVKTGEVVVICGPSGSGTSTLFRIIN